MNREALDEFFAKAEDVLADWEPSDDAMVAQVEDEGADLPVADSYYVQPWTDRAPTIDSVPPALGPFAEMLDRSVLFGESFVQVQPQGIVHISTVGRSPFDDIRQLQRAIEPPPEPRADWQGPDPMSVILDETCGWRHLGHTDSGGEVYWAPLAESPRDRALRLRRERNTGPAGLRGLDGRRRRG